MQHRFRTSSNAPLRTAAAMSSSLSATVSWVDSAAVASGPEEEKSESIGVVVVDIVQCLDVKEKGVEDFFFYSSSVSSTGAGRDWGARHDFLVSSNTKRQEKRELVSFFSSFPETSKNDKKRE